MESNEDPLPNEYNSNAPEKRPPGLWMSRRRVLSVISLSLLLLVILGLVLYPRLISLSHTTSVQPRAVPAIPTPTPTPLYALTPIPPPIANHQSDVTYHDGPVQVSPNAYLIFWGSAWQSSQELKKTKQYIESYFAKVGGSSYESVLTQYFMRNADGTKPFVTNTSRFSESQVWVDPVDPVNDDQKDCAAPAISNNAIKNEILHAISAATWTNNGLNATYFVYTPPSFTMYEPEYEAYGADCSAAAWSGDHEWMPDKHLVYAAMPYPSANSTCAAKFLGPDLSQNECDEALLVDFSAHEQFEAITDPTSSRPSDHTFKNQGWFLVVQGDAEEIGDLCGDKMLQGTSFVLQSMWSNQAGGCI